MIEIWTDGACSGNPGPGGWGAHIHVDGKIVVRDAKQLLCVEVVGKK